MFIYICIFWQPTFGRVAGSMDWHWTATLLLFEGWLTDSLMHLFSQTLSRADFVAVACFCQCLWSHSVLVKHVLLVVAIPAMTLP